MFECEGSAVFGRLNRFDRIERRKLTCGRTVRLRNVPKRHYLRDLTLCQQQPLSSVHRTERSDEVLR